MFVLALLAAITLSVSGYFFIADEVKLRVEVVVPVDRDNRKVIIEWTGDGPQSSDGLTSKQLDEYVDWTHHTFYILLRPGHYSIRGRLIQSNGRETVTRVETVEVIESTPPH